MVNAELTRREQDIVVIEQTLNAFMEPGLAVAHIDEFTFESTMNFDTTANNDAGRALLDGLGDQLEHVNAGRVLRSAMTNSGV